MAVPLIVNGVTFQYPVDFDTNWGVNATGWAQAVTAGMLQKSGGSFPLTADVDFGPTFGIKSPYYKSEAVSIATTGVLRLGATDAIAFGTSNYPLTTDGSGNLTWRGNILATSAGDVNSIIGTANQIIASSPTGNVTLSLPQDIALISSPSFASEHLTNTTNQLILGTTNTTTLNATAPAASRVITFGDPLGNDSVVYLAATQTLTNKTLTSPTLVTPALGQPTSGDLTNTTNIPVNQAIGILAVTHGGTGVTTSTGTGSVVLNNTPTLIAPLLGTPTSGVLTNATGLPIDAGTVNTLPVARGGTAQTSYTDGQLLIGNTATTSLTKATLTGTANQVIVTNGNGSITLSTPQNIDSTATPTFASETLTSTTNQLILGTTRTVTISATQPATSSRVYTIPDQGAAANFLLDKANYTIGGTWTFSNDTTLASSKKLILTDNTTNTVGVKATNSTTSWTLSLPTTAGLNTQVLTTDGSGNTSWVSQSGSGTVNAGTATHLAYYATSANAVSDANGASITGTYTYTGGAGAITMSGSTIAMGGNKITGLAAATANGDALRYEQLNGLYLLLTGGTVSGQTTFSSATLFADGTVSLPGIAFSSDTNTGIYRIGADNPAIAANGSVFININDGTSGGVQIRGTTTTTNAPAGFIGEYIESVVGTTSGFTNAGWDDATSISLTQGDWDITGIVQFDGSTVVTVAIMGISITSGNSSTGLVDGSSKGYASIPTATIDATACVPVLRKTFSTTTTVYLKVFITDATQRKITGGRISARRVR